MTKKASEIQKKRIKELEEKANALIKNAVPQRLIR